ncbi:MAG: WecB/TagA/CpsF family glycosyltransferase [Candidatus Daviesbacteria bacterium]|nr:WecB/TagA/CpsF family glycosyltransferase [Candidatus Daviesbacteria bacterium]
MKTQILGVKIDDIKMDEALDQIVEWLSKKGKHYIVTPNPEILMAAQKDKVYRKILNNADLAIPDGAGLRFSGKIKNTFAGTDFMEKLVELAHEKGFTTGFLGGKDEVANKCTECLLQKYPKLKIALISSDPEVKIPPMDLLFVALGHGKQEKWIADNLDKVPVHIAMGVGGAFDYLSGNVPRAPRWMRGLGLEWLFRLVVQPWRIKRQVALIRYLWLIAS